MGLSLARNSWGESKPFRGLLKYYEILYLLMDKWHLIQWYLGYFKHGVDMGWSGRFWGSGRFEGSKSSKVSAILGEGWRVYSDIPYVLRSYRI